ncbi:MAG: hypothetical protein PV340_04405 [Wolbachia sp.]|nr:hypothetical protein [Wolbachia sp.]
MALRTIKHSGKFKREDLEMECVYGIGSNCKKLEKCSGKIIYF